MVLNIMYDGVLIILLVGDLLSVNFVVLIMFGVDISDDFVG